MCKWREKKTVAKGLNEPVTKLQTAIAGKKRNRKGDRRGLDRAGGTECANFIFAAGHRLNATIPHDRSRTILSRSITCAEDETVFNRPGSLPPNIPAIAPTPIPSEKKRLNAKGRW